MRSGSQKMGNAFFLYHFLLQSRDYIPFDIDR